MSLASAQGWRRFAGATFIIVGLNFSYNKAKQRGWISPDFTHHLVRDINEPAEQEVSEYDRLMALAERKSKLQESLDEVKVRVHNTVEVSPEVKACMRQYQQDHPDGYLLWHAIKHCKCEIPYGVDTDKLKKLFVRSEGQLSEELTAVELELIGASVKPHRKALKWEEARRLRTFGLPQGVDPDKPYNDLLVRAMASGPMDGPYHNYYLGPYLPNDMFSAAQLENKESWLAHWERGRNS